MASAPKHDEDPLNIVLVHAADQGGGAEACTLSLHLALRRLGHNSRLLVGTKKTDVPGVYEIQRFRCFPGVLRAAKWLEDHRGWQYVYHPWFRRIPRIVDGKIDVLHFHTLWSGRLGYADIGGLPRLTRRCPSMMTLHDMWMLTGHCAYPPLECDRWRIGCGKCPDLSCVPSVDRDGTSFNWRRKQTAIRKSRLRVTAVSNWLSGEVRQSPVFQGKPVYTVYNGINEEWFYPREKAAVRSQLGIPRDAFVVMMAGQSIEGTFNRGGGAVEFALKALAESRVQPLALLVGHSADKVAARWPGPKCVQPFQTDPKRLADLYSAADVTLVASQRETFGRIPAESLMCGTPVVTFAVGGLAEVVQEGDTGLIVRNKDCAAMGASLRLLHDRPELRRQMSVAAVADSRRRFGNEAVARQYVEHYREVIAEHRTAAER